MSIRLLRLGKRGRWRRAVRLACANPALNSYFLFTGLMLLLYFLNSSFGYQGRYWLPYLPATVLVATRYAPRALPRGRARALFSGLLTIGLALYCLFGSYYALEAIRVRYYGSGRTLTAIALPDLRSASQQTPYSIDYVNSTILAPGPRYAPTFVFAPVSPSRPPVVPAGSMLAVGGWAVDTGGVFVSVDGTMDFRAVYGQERPDVAQALRDEAHAKSGFDLLLPTDQLPPGKHYLTVKIVSKDQTSYFESPRKVVFEIK